MSSSAGSLLQTTAELLQSDFEDRCCTLKNALTILVTYDRHGTGAPLRVQRALNQISNAMWRPPATLSAPTDSRIPWLAWGRSNALGMLCLRCRCRLRGWVSNGEAAALLGVKKQSIPYLREHHLQVTRAGQITFDSLLTWEALKASV